MSRNGQIYITQEQLQSVIPGIKDVADWCQALNEVLPKYGIDTNLRIAAFIAQVAHESGSFRYTSENLNYSESGLLKVFGKYFTPAQAKAYARQPEKIANRVYANRMGNGNEASGDGWRYRGGGLIQLTGKNNYSAFAKDIGMSVEDAADYVRTKQGAVESAAWFWRENDLDRFADAKDIKRMTRAINGGYNGLDDRMAFYNRALKVFS